MPKPNLDTPNLDQWYTRTEVARQCLGFLEAHVDTANAFFLEPSAGTGAFLCLLPEDRRLGLDLDPKHPRVQYCDFLQFAGAGLPSPDRVIAIGNPPFGRNSSLALRFLNRAGQLADTVAFILPRTFRKHSILCRVAPRLHLLAEMEVPPMAFIRHGTLKHVPCVFQIWVRREEARVAVAMPVSHPDFAFVRAEDADFAIRRVGALAGRVIEDFAGYSPNSHYFLKASPDCREILARVAAGAVCADTAGCPSLSKRELVQLYQEAVAA